MYTNHVISIQLTSNTALFTDALICHLEGTVHFGMGTNVWLNLFLD